MSTCDICGEETSWKVGTGYTAGEFRKLVSLGYEPYERLATSLNQMMRMAGISRQQAMAQWKSGLVEHSDTDWLLCPLCAQGATKYLPKKAGAGPSGAKPSEPFKPEMFAPPESKDGSPPLSPKTEPIHVNCPGCGARLKGDANARGKRIKCPKCGDQFKVPGKVEAPSAAKNVAVVTPYQDRGVPLRTPVGSVPDPAPQSRDTGLSELETFIDAAKPLLEKEAEEIPRDLDKLGLDNSTINLMLAILKAHNLLNLKSKATVIKSWERLLNSKHTSLGTRELEVVGRFWLHLMSTVQTCDLVVDGIELGLNQLKRGFAMQALRALSANPRMGLSDFSALGNDMRDVETLMSQVEQIVMKGETVSSARSTIEHMHDSIKTGMKALGPPMVPIIRDFLQESGRAEGGKLTCRAIQVLYEFGKSAAKAQSVLVELVKAGKDEVRGYAAGALGAIGDPKSVTAIVEALRDETSKNKGDESLPVCQMVAALRTFGASAAPAAPALLTLVRTRTPRGLVRDFAITALKDIREPQLVPTIVEVLREDASKEKDDESQSLRNLIDQLGQLGRKAAQAVPVLAALVEKRQGTVKLVAIEALGKIGSEDAIPVLSKLRDARKFFHFLISSDEAKFLHPFAVRQASERALKQITHT